MSNIMLWIFSIVLLFTACNPLRQTPPPTISSDADVIQKSPQTPEPTFLPGSIPTRTATLSPSLTPFIQPAQKTSPTATATPRLNVDPRGQTVEFWHAWGKRSASKVMAEIVHEFNTENEWAIEVIPIGKDSYWDLEYAFPKALSMGEEPNLILAYPNVLAKLWDQEVLEDVYPYLHDPQYGLPADVQIDFYPEPHKAGNFDRALVGFPFSQSGNVIFYNRTWAMELGFQDPPTNAAEFTLQACAASQSNNYDTDPNNDGTGGFVLYPGTANILSWIYAFEGQVFNPDTQQYAFNSQPVLEVALFLQDLINKGCAYQTKTYPNPEFATRKALFTTSSTVGCQYQQEEFERQGSVKDEWELIAFPGKDGLQAMVIFPQMIGLVDRSPEEDLASWLFMKYLITSEVQVKWVMESQYYPVRMSVLNQISEFSSAHPQWASGIDLLYLGRSEPTHPSWELVRQYTQTTFTNLIEKEVDEFSDLLADLDMAAIEAMTINP